MAGLLTQLVVNLQFSGTTLFSSLQSVKLNFNFLLYDFSCESYLRGFPRLRSLSLFHQRVCLLDDDDRKSLWSRNIEALQISALSHLVDLQLSRPFCSFWVILLFSRLERTNAHQTVFIDFFLLFVSLFHLQIQKWHKNLEQSFSPKQKHGLKTVDPKKNLNLKMQPRRNSMLLQMHISYLRWPFLLLRASQPLLSTSVYSGAREKFLEACTWIRP